MDSYENPALSHECDLTAERDRLREQNAELIAAIRTALAVGQVVGDSKKALQQALAE